MSSNGSDYCLVYRLQEAKDPPKLVFQSLQENGEGKIVKEVILGEVFVNYDPSSNSLVFLANREVASSPAGKPLANKSMTPANKMGKTLSTGAPEPKASMPNTKRSLIKRNSLLLDPGTSEAGDSKNGRLEQPETIVFLKMNDKQVQDARHADEEDLKIVPLNYRELDVRFSTNK